MEEDQNVTPEDWSRGRFYYFDQDEIVLIIPKRFPRPTPVAFKTRVVIILLGTEPLKSLGDSLELENKYNTSLPRKSRSLILKLFTRDK